MGAGGSSTGIEGKATCVLAVLLIVPVGAAGCLDSAGVAEVVVHADHSAKDHEYLDVLVRFDGETVYQVNLTEPLATGASDMFEWPPGPVEVTVRERNSNQTHVETIDLRGGANHVIIVIGSERISVRNEERSGEVM